MAGDWIKIEHATPDKPEVFTMSTILQIDQDAVTGKLIRLWTWADQQSQDGHEISVTDSFIDRITFCNGFARALRQVGWLGGRDSRLSIPNFDRHNGQSAKKRAEAAVRKRKSRESSDGGHTNSVTKVGPEERRGELVQKEKEPPANPPEEQEVIDHVHTLGSNAPGPWLSSFARSFWAYWETQDWQTNNGTDLRKRGAWQNRLKADLETAVRNGEHRKGEEPAEARKRKGQGSCL